MVFKSPNLNGDRIIPSQAIASGESFPRKECLKPGQGSPFVEEGLGPY